MNEIHLGVNIDHVATLRQARRVSYPNLVDAAAAAERGGADGITIHLREDRRHIQDADVDSLSVSVATKLNLEMACVAEMVAIALRVRPFDVCLVPEKREELTTEGGLDVAGNVGEVEKVVRELQGSGIRVSLFIDPDDSQVDASRAVGADVVELHTGTFANVAPEGHAAELSRIQRAAMRAGDAGMIVNAGHGLTVNNVGPIAAIPNLFELNIGHSIIADALFVGLEEATRRMKQRMVAARANG